MPSFDLFKYSRAPLISSEDSLLEKIHHRQTEGLLGKEQALDRRDYDRPPWRTITLRARKIVVMLLWILKFVLGLRWQLNGNRRCLEVQSFYCTHILIVYSLKEVLIEKVSPRIESDRQSLPPGAIQWHSNLAITIPRPPNPRIRRPMGQIGGP